MWAPNIFTWIFGSQWLLAGEFAQSLVLWMVFVFCNIPSVLFAQVIRIQRIVLINDLIALSGRAIVLVMGGMYLDPNKTIVLFAIFAGFMNVVLIVIVGIILMKRERCT